MPLDFGRLSCNFWKYIVKYKAEEWAKQTGQFYIQNICLNPNYQKDFFYRV
ncbi:10065_t:CDS:2 [Funneliformis geosporum]|uniref:10065_t:CDS:1 n=1 Tax=Funneliformis geosporum TaxID=1117311 RepID=A0A9W4SHL2_9GLOM|nr:10065_t:CDS:2 [Funneliformis geosporum]